MRILWVVNTIFPSLSLSLGLQPPMSGSWMYGLAEKISEQNDIKLTVVTVYNGKEILEKRIDGIDYILIPMKNKKMWGGIFDQVKPQLVHIHGSEFSYGLDLMEQRPEGKYVLSIQGLVSVCADYYLAGLSIKDVIKNITLRDLLKNDNLFQARNKFKKRGGTEKKYFSKVDAIIGRTDWDRAHTWAFNQNLPYYHCDEMLRKEFYTDEKWSYENCEKNSIFISAANYPLKGFHQVLKAANLVKKTCPDLRIYVAGHKVCGDGTLKSELKLSGYGLYIKKLIRKYKLEQNVVFLGVLTAEQMKERYLKSHIFICPSSIENSPNSVAEAQILGVPVLASHVGGISSLVKHQETGFLYEYGDYTILANYISQILLNKINIAILSECERNIAKERHNKDIIVEQLRGCYILKVGGGKC